MSTETVEFDGRKISVEDYQQKLDNAIKPEGKKLHEYTKLSCAECYQGALDDDIRPIEKSADEARETKIQALKYLLCMTSAGIIEALSYAILLKILPIPRTDTMHFLDPEPLLKYIFVAECISLALSIVWNFTLNRKFTFKSAKNVPIAMALAFLFYVPFFPFAAWYVPKLSRIMTAAVGLELALTIAKGTKMILNGVLEFLWQKFVIYRNDTNTAEK